MRLRMREAWLCVLASILTGWSLVVVAQETTEPEAEAAVETADATEDAETTAAADADTDADELDDLDADLDLQTYEQDDDDFVPTEEVPADQAIPFPSDI